MGMALITILSHIKCLINQMVILKLIIKWVAKLHYNISLLREDEAFLVQIQIKLDEERSSTNGGRMAQR